MKDQFCSKMNSHRSYLERFAVKLSGSKDAAEDLVQGTYCKVLTHYSRSGQLIWETYDPNQDMKRWLRTILLNLFLANKRKDKVHLGYCERNETLSTPSCEAALVKKEEHQLLHDSIKKLSDENQKIVNLYWFEDMTLKEIGRRIQKSTTTVSNRIDKILGLLRQEYS